MDFNILDTLGYGQQVTRHDDVNLSAFVQNELLNIIPQLYDRKFRELDALEHVPLQTNINPGAMSWAYDSFDHRGEAKFMGGNARDMPRADVSKQRFVFPIRTIVSSYGWTIEEMEAARFAGTNLDVRKGDAARRAIGELEHNTVLFGSLPRNIPAFLRNPATPLMTVANGAWLSGATPDQMVDDLNSMVDAVYTGTNRVHQVNAILLPNAHFRRISTARLPNTGLTVLKFFMDTNPLVREVRPLTELATESAAGGPRAIAYQKDSMNLGAVVPLSFQQLDPQLWGFEMVIPARERLGGTVWFYPASAIVVDGI